MNNDSQQTAAGSIYVGCSGWAYPTWKPDFYPKEIPSKKFLEYYATRLNSVEVNYTFRAVPKAPMIENWLAQTGDGFRFSFKAPQRITHIKRLNDCASSLEFFCDAVRPVAEAGRMGPVLFQLPPNLKADQGRLAAFLADAKEMKVRIAFEFRHQSWFDPAIYALLERCGAALCVAESDELQTPDVVTAPFSCYRLRQSDYTDEALHAIADRLRRRAEGGDVFAYFKHEEDPTGAVWAAKVLALLRESSAA
ncbi:MAG TPA: DUF72 domain-containing protein [Acidobacteriaceae bacterium]|nr:DUF72 domain-containing protein [Acidobacteriaceae bacterium]